MYEQSLVKVIEPVKKTTISRLNKSKKWTKSASHYWQLGGYQIPWYET